VFSVTSEAKKGFWMTVRRRAREIALQVLYQLDHRPGEPSRGAGNLFREFPALRESREFSRRLMRSLRPPGGNRPLIEENAENWTLKRMATVDRNILRLAAFELMHCPDIPFKASLNEAIELAKDTETMIRGFHQRHPGQGSFSDGVLPRTRCGFEAKSMRWAILSDVHGNWRLFGGRRGPAAEKAEKVAFLGDSVATGPIPMSAFPSSGT